MHTCEDGPKYSALTLSLTLEQLTALSYQPQRRTARLRSVSFAYRVVSRQCSPATIHTVMSPFTTTT